MRYISILNALDLEKKRKKSRVSEKKKHTRELLKGRVTKVCEAK